MMADKSYFHIKYLLFGGYKAHVTFISILEYKYIWNTYTNIYFSQNEYASTVEFHIIFN